MGEIFKSQFIHRCQEAFDLGVAAKSDGVTRDQCPYLAADKYTECNFWLDGYDGKELPWNRQNFEVNG
jgi:ribosome modulation factor